MNTIGQFQKPIYILDEYYWSIKIISLETVNFMDLGPYSLDIVSVGHRVRELDTVYVTPPQNRCVRSDTTELGEQ